MRVLVFTAISIPFFSRLGAEYLCCKMRPAHLVLAMAMWFAVYIETAKGFAVPPNNTVAEEGLPSVKAICIFLITRPHPALIPQRRRATSPKSLDITIGKHAQKRCSHISAHMHGDRHRSAAVVCARVPRHTCHTLRCCGTCNNDQHCSS